MDGKNEPLLRYSRRPYRRHLAAVVRTYYSFVWRCAVRLTGNREDASDICQDVFLRLLVKPPKQHSFRSARIYLALQVLRRAHNLERSVERRRERERGAAARGQKSELSLEDRLTLYAAVAELPSELRSGVLLRFFAGMQSREIGQELGIPARTVRDRLNRAKEMLRARLGQAKLGPAILFEGLGGSADPPPSALLPELLRIVKMGSALSAASRLTFIGGTLMAKKITVAAASLLIGAFLLTVGYRFLSTERRMPDQTEEKAAEPTLAASNSPEPEHSDESHVLNVIFRTPDLVNATAQKRGIEVKGQAKWHYQEEGGGIVLEMAGDEPQALTFTSPHFNAADLDYRFRPDALTVEGRWRAAPNGSWEGFKVGVGGTIAICLEPLEERTDSSPSEAKRTILQDLSENSIQDLLLDFGLPINSYVPKECEDRIWDLVLDYREAHEKWWEKRQAVFQDLFQKHLERGEYYTPEAYKRVALKPPFNRAATYGAEIEGEDVVVPIWADEDSRISDISHKLNKAWRETIAKIRETFEGCIEPGPSAPLSSKGKPAPHPALLRKDSVPEILSWLGFPPYGQLTPKDQEAVWALIDEYRATYRELEDERANLVARIIEYKSQAGEYYKGDAFRKICFDPRFVERPEEVQPIPVDGEQVYVTVGLRDDPHLREIAHAKADLYVSTIAELRSILAKYNKGEPVKYPARSTEKVAGKEPSRTSSNPGLSSTKETRGRQETPPVSMKPAPSLSKQPVYIDPRLPYENTAELLDDFGYPKDLALSQEDREAIFNILNEYDEMVGGIDRAKAGITHDIIEEKYERCEYYDLETYQTLQHNPSWFSTTKAHSSREIDGEHKYVVVFRKELDQRRRELQRDKKLLFQDTVAEIQAILSNAMASPPKSKK